jgi:hypothetical protein
MKKPSVPKKATLVEAITTEEGESEIQPESIPGKMRLLPSKLYNNR